MRADYCPMAGEPCQSMCDQPCSAHRLKLQADVVAKAWEEGYRAGINDERMSEANIGISGFNAKIEPARNNPYRSKSPPTEPARTSQDVCTVPLLSDEEIDACDEVARKSFRYSQGRVCGQILKPSDSFDWHFARAIEQLVRRNAGL